MKNRFFILLLAIVACACNHPKPEENNSIVKPTAAQMEWADCELGVLIHFDMPVFRPEYNWEDFGTHPEPSIFNPSELNTDQWLETAQKLGAKYAVLVAKHCSGFCLWPTETIDYSVKNSPWKDGHGDIVADFIKSCEKYGIKPGIYASTGANGYLHVNAHKIADDAPVTFEEYTNIVEKQLTELWTNYGKLFEIWFDGGLLSMDMGGADVLSLVQKLQPDAIAFQGPYGYPNLIRWVGNEVGLAPYLCWATADSTTNSDGTLVVEGMNGNPDAPFWCPGESDCTLRYKSSFQGGWFWKAGEDSLIYTLDEMMKRYETSVGRNTNMLLGLVIDDRGLVPEEDVKRVEEFGKAIKEVYGTPIKQTSGQGNEIAISFDEPTEISRVVIQENIAKGERVLGYTLEGMSVDGGEWAVICTGSNIGHKHIDSFDPQRLTAIRVVVNKSKAEPDIKNFAAFR